MVGIRIDHRGIKLDSNQKIEDEQQKLLAIAEAKFKGLTNDFLKEGLVDSYSLTLPNNEDAIIRLQLIRHSDSKVIMLQISSHGECFDASYGDVFHKGTSCAYDLPEKLEELNDLLDYAKFYVQGHNYHEEVYTRNGEVIYRKLVLHKGARIGSFVVQKNGGIGSSSVPFGYFRRFFCKKTVVTPPSSK